MRIIMLIALIVSVTALKAQTFIRGGFLNNSYGRGFARNIDLNDSTSKKKWSFSKYSSISTSYTFFKGGNASIVSAPVGVQLNRRVTNNLYAFAGVSVAPSYINFNRSFVTTDFNKANQNNTFLKTNSFGVYSRADLGLQYVNDERTFSISGSIGVERSNFPRLHYYNTNDTRYNQVVPANR